MSFILNVSFLYSLYFDVYCAPQSSQFGCKISKHVCKMHWSVFLCFRGKIGDHNIFQLWSYSSYWDTFFELLTTRIVESSFDFDPPKITVHAPSGCAKFRQSCVVYLPCVLLFADCKRVYLRSVSEVSHTDNDDFVGAAECTVLHLCCSCSQGASRILSLLQRVSNYFNSSVLVLLIGQHEIRHAQFPPFRWHSSIAVSPFPLAVSVHRCRCVSLCLGSSASVIGWPAMEQRKK